MIDLDILIVGGLVLVIAAIFWLLVRFVITTSTRKSEAFAKELRALRQDTRAAAEDAAAADGCRRCQHFDLEEGQAAMRAHPNFLRAAAVLPPAEMSRSVSYQQQPCPRCPSAAPAADCELCGGVGKIEVEVRSPPSAPYKARWDEYGACLAPGNADSDGNPVLVWGREQDCKGRFFQLRTKASS